ncbi:hypothetical protein K437DRAFT_262029 [Tilletiaria anomala UBC 951]|uniref:Uncharacterized protein n=1 Tax=Tilletiaria anomala (strain ATCC 24038 / CBS 436.72 / UBC 951) TaxID=1037660 RepID=A0A066WFM8_TILAU|nr:uncharacterized protein K437DRAFT_262029 [Tilletiaria anomala UBC 951]KDN49555.1 hypothetical protein K437DRAFT_262029 [Tilletiaria anomala UBC 951]
MIAFSGGIENEGLEAFECKMNGDVRCVYIGSNLSVEEMMKREPRPLLAKLEDDLNSNQLVDSWREIEARPRLRPPYSYKLESSAHAELFRKVLDHAGSIHSLIGGLRELVYAAVEGAVAKFSQQAARNNAYRRIQVNCNCPSHLDTAKTSNIPLELAAQRPAIWPHRSVRRIVAKTVVLLAQDAPWVPGSTVVVTVGTTARPSTVINSSLSREELGFEFFNLMPYAEGQLYAGAREARCAKVDEEEALATHTVQFSAQSSCPVFTKGSPTKANPSPLVICSSVAFGRPYAGTAKALIVWKQRRSAATS